MTRVRLARQAERDIAEAANYLDHETGNPQFGHRLVEELQHVMRLIGENPEMGRERPELQAGLRFIPHGSHAIFWRLNGDTVRILRVLHQRQDVQKAFGRKR